MALMSSNFLTTVTHAAITRQGGSIWADALPDGGAKLYFTLGQDIDSATAN